MSAKILVVDDEPSIVIPMHYRTSELSLDLAPVHPFLSALGVGDLEPREVLRITTKTLPEAMQAVLLNPRR